MYVTRQDAHRLGQLGWFVKTPVSPEGHEVLTYKAIAGLSLTPLEIQRLIEGVRRPDTASLTAHVAPDEQRRHVLRRNIQQSSRAGLDDAINHLRALHTRILAAGTSPEAWRLIGEALHLVQDSFAPAHVRRSGGAGRIRYVRNYGPTNLLLGEDAPGPVVRARDGRVYQRVTRFDGLPFVGKVVRQAVQHGREHGFPVDLRDHIYTAPTSDNLKKEAEAAVAASREYLKLVLRHRNDRASASVVRQDLDAFVARYLSM